MPTHPDPAPPLFLVLAVAGQEAEEQLRALQERVEGLQAELEARDEAIDLLVAAHKDSKDREDALEKEINKLKKALEETRKSVVEQAKALNAEVANLMRS